MKKELIYTVAVKIATNRDVYENRIAWCIENAGKHQEEWKYRVLYEREHSNNLALYSFAKEECASEFVLRFS